MATNKKDLAMGIIWFSAAFALGVGLISSHWLPLEITVGGSIIVWLASILCLGAWAESDLKSESKVED